MSSESSWQKWVIGLFGALLLLALSGTGWLYSDSIRQLDQQRITDYQHGERITRLEEQFKAIKESLDRIERKIDPR